MGFKFAHGTFTVRVDAPKGSIRLCGAQSGSPLSVRVNGTLRILMRLVRVWRMRMRIALL